MRLLLTGRFDLSEGKQLFVWRGTAQVAVSLLDPAKGHAIQTWEFDGTTLIRIGRGDSNDIVIGDPSVSRLHAELVSEGGRWRIVSLGRNGTLIDGEPVSEPALIRHGTLIQLGSNGPWMEFAEGGRTSRGGETISWESAPMELPTVDESLMQEEVNRIADAEGFQGIQKQAQELKKSRDSEPSE